MEKIDIGRGKKRMGGIGGRAWRRAQSYVALYQELIGSQWPGGMAN
jgi:hypothetical protein